MKITQEIREVVKKQLSLLLFMSLLSGVLPGSLLQVEALDAKSAALEQTDRNKPDKANTDTTTTSTTTTSTTTTSSSSSKSNTESKDGKLEVLSLNDLNDVAILLRFIREQAINIYEEAARVPVGTSASPDYKPFEVIPLTLKTKSFLPARQEWLVFYLGVMEPVIRDLAKEAAAFEAGSKQLVIPKAMEEVLNPAWEGWSQNTKEMNRHLDELVPMFDGAPPDNAAIQNKAVEIYGDVNELEKLRKQIFIVLRDSLKAGGKDKILISPP